MGELLLENVVKKEALPRPGWVVNKIPTSTMRPIMSSIAMKPRIQRKGLGHVMISEHIKLPT